MKSHIFQVHSIVDVITNSSTVIYTMASDNTIRAIKRLIDNLLGYAGFHDALAAQDKIDVSLYPPEAFSKFIDLGPMTVHRSSFDLGRGVPVEEFFNGAS